MADLQYSPVAAQQLDDIEDTDPELYDDLMDAIETISAKPGDARSYSAVIQTPQGPVFKTFVEGRYPMAIFWSEHPATGVRIEASFPHKRNRR